MADEAIARQANETALTRARAIVRKAQQSGQKSYATGLREDIHTRVRYLVEHEASKRIAAGRARGWRWFWLAMFLAVVFMALGFNAPESAAAVAISVLGVLGAWVGAVVMVRRVWNANDQIRQDSVLRTHRITEDALKVGIDFIVEAEARQHQAEMRERYEEMERRREAGMPAPEPQPYGVSHEGAEALVAQWMRHLGAVDAEITQYSGDGGIDVSSEQYIAQVKNYSGSVGVAEIRELAGVAAVDGRTPLFFTSGTLTADAATFAQAAKIAVFQYDAVAGTLEGLDDTGRDATRSGL